MRCVRDTHSGESVADPRMQFVRTEISLHQCRCTVARSPQGDGLARLPQRPALRVVAKEIDSSIENLYKILTFPIQRFVEKLEICFSVL